MARLIGDWYRGVASARVQHNARGSSRRLHKRLVVPASAVVALLVSVHHWRAEVALLPEHHDFVLVAELQHWSCILEVAVLAHLPLRRLGSLEAL